ncbi:MAG: FKBP-type peptidyl-prolyl cis-trans isomerase [Dysgonomonas sp.]
MKGKAYIYLFLFITLAVGMTSCFDDNATTIDTEWKLLNEQAFNDLPTTTSTPAGEYRVLSSQSNNGYVKWKPDSVITKSDVDPIPAVTSTQKPLFTDTVVVRYEGWYFDKDGTKIIFESTENPYYGSTTNPNKMSKTFTINNASYVCDGWVTLLTNMTVGEEREVWIPWTLGYGSSSYTSSVTSLTIPAYTTLRYRIKLLEIKSMAG